MGWPVLHPDSQAASQGTGSVLKLRVKQGLRAHKWLRVSRSPHHENRLLRPKVPTTCLAVKYRRRRKRRSQPPESPSLVSRWTSLPRGEGPRQRARRASSTSNILIEYQWCQQVYPMLSNRKRGVRILKSFTSLAFQSGMPTRGREIWTAICRRNWASNLVPMSNQEPILDKETHKAELWRNKGELRQLEEYLSTSRCSRKLMYILTTRRPHSRAPQLRRGTGLEVSLLSKVWELAH